MVAEERAPAVQEPAGPQVAVLAVDVGTSSTKGVLVAADGSILGTAVREHDVQRPTPGCVEMDAEVWWEEFTSIARELTTAHPKAEVQSVGVSGMGPCVLLTTEDGTPVRPAILYGVDTRATAQIQRLTEELGEQEILERGGSVLTTQAAGPKIAWVRENEPDVYARARRLLMPASFLAYRLTGEYVLDHHSASQCSPLYDSAALAWHEPWWQQVAEGIEAPALRWPADQAGTVTEQAAQATGLPAGIPVVTGSIDAWTEAVSADAQNPGDLMLMYGTTMFLVATSEQRTMSRTLWGTVGAFPGTYCLAGGMATSGAITGWLRRLTGDAPYAQLVKGAAEAGPGAGGLLMLPYFAGERTPVQDPDARGTLIGLTLDHGRGHLYRAALEATAFGVRHNLEALREGGAPISRVVAVGGGTQGGLWTQIVSDITGIEQVVPTSTIGASYGAAILAADHAPGIDGTATERAAQWNPPAQTLTPDPSLTALYDELYSHYRALYPATAQIAHALSDLQRRR